MGRLDGKVALISGGARGMGAAEALLFAGEGARVAVGDVLDDAARETAEEIGDAAVPLRLDGTREDDWDEAVRRTLEAFGRLDVLVNNAGVGGVARIEKTSLEQYRAITEVNQTGVFLGIRAAIAPMTAAGGGSIVNISSIDGLVGMPRVLPYVASKFAVRGMTKTAAVELADRGIRVNSIHPGHIATPMNNPGGTDEAARRMQEYCERDVPLARIGQPEEIARLALFLASDESSYCTGSEFTADGGLIASVPLPG
ncbi:MAG: glucose 1-dehydrogenase [Proteobacteria bacterium]|nr:glucose 1-dehydrogenase [Pseudomonadota bacterium]